MKTADPSVPRASTGPVIPSHGAGSACSGCLYPSGQPASQRASGPWREGDTGCLRQGLCQAAPSEASFSYWHVPGGSICFLRGLPCPACPSVCTCLRERPPGDSIIDSCRRLNTHSGHVLSFILSCHCPGGPSSVLVRNPIICPSVCPSVYPFYTPGPWVRLASEGHSRKQDKDSTQAGGLVSPLLLGLQDPD